MARTKDISGQRFGNLVAIRPTNDRKYGCVVWECNCDCGNFVFVPTVNLLHDNTKSCGCLMYKGVGRKMRDLQGQVFGRLTAIAPTNKRNHGFIVWECRCDCGETAYVSSDSLTSGDTKSCGCLRRKHKVDIHV